MSNSIFDWFALIAENAIIYGGAFILVLSLLVFVHEWGHYIVARMCGVKVESFSIGFGKELFGFTDKNDTRWKFSLIPLGGYVKMYGDIDPASAGHSEMVEGEGEAAPARPMTEKERSEAFFTQPVAKRSAIVFAGPAINFLFAIILMAGMYMFYGQPVTPPVATAVVGGSAAEKAGFMPHDQIISIGGRKINRFEDIRREVMVGLDTPKTYVVLRNGEEVSFMAQPEKLEFEDRFGFKHSRGQLGIISPGSVLRAEDIMEINGTAVSSPDQARNLLGARMGEVITLKMKPYDEIEGDEPDILIVQPLAENNQNFLAQDSEAYGLLNVSESTSEYFVKHDPFSALAYAIHETGSITMSTLESLGQMITGTRPATELGGIIRIGAIAGDMAKSGLVALILFTALLSINLGLINLFPIPMLDGGHLFFYGIEALRGSPISEQVQEYAFRFGLVVLIGIMVFANLNDLMQLVL